MLALVDVLEAPSSGGGDTTNVTVVDADGNACVITTSLGLGSGDFLPGLDLHLNSMLGEADLLRGRLEPGPADAEHDGADARLRPTTGLAFAAGAAGGTRLAHRAARRRVGRPRRRALAAEEAVARPRFHPAPEVVNAEPGVDEDALAATRRARPDRAPLAGAAPLLRWCQRRQPDSVRLADPRRNGAASHASLKAAGVGRDPAHVATVGTAGVLLHCSAGERLRVDRCRTRGSGRSRRRRAVALRLPMSKPRLEDSALCGNLRAACHEPKGPRGPGLIRPAARPRGSPRRPLRSGRRAPPRTRTPARPGAGARARPPAAAP